MPSVSAGNLHGTISTGSLRGGLNTGSLNGGLNVPKTATVLEKDYNKLINKPQINGVELSGNVSLQDLYIVSENTRAGWSDNPQYLPKAGEICVYTDYMTIQDDIGRDITYPGIKIGDGNAYLIDLPFVGDETRYLLLKRIQEHENNTDLHIQPGERTLWNNKLNYDVENEDLILTRN